MYNPAVEMAGNQTYISKAYFLKVPAENDVHYRPLQAKMDNNTFEQFVDVTNRGHDVGAGAVQRVARQIISPSMTSQGKVHINGGWQQERFAVVLEFTVKPMGSMPPSREIFFGYTNHDGIQPSGVMNHNMLIMLNSHTRLLDTVAHGAQGVVRNTRVTDNSQILTPFSATAGNYIESASHSMRPGDALRAAQANMVFGNNDQAVSADGRNIIMPHGSLSNFENTSSAKYLGKVLSAHKMELGTSEEEYCADSEVIGEAANKIIEASMMRSSTLSRLMSDTSLRSEGVITIGELIATFGNFVDDPKVTNISFPKNGQSLVNMANEVQHWGGSDYETNIAYGLSNMIPAIIMKNLAISCDFTVTNQTITGEDHAAITGFSPLLSAADQNQSVMRIHADLLSSVIPEIIPHGFEYHIEMESKLMYNSKIKVSLNGQPPVEFSAPNYCSSIATPLVSSDPNTTARIGGMVNDLLEVNSMFSREKSGKEFYI